jgi:alpha-galactosidase
VLTAEKEALWRKWIGLYRANMLAKGTYRGDLYDVGFDKPEAHAVEKDGAMHYAFYAEKNKPWSGTVTLRGLGKGRYTLIDSFTGASLGTATAAHNTIPAAFEHFLLVRATPVARAA